MSCQSLRNNRLLTYKLWGNGKVKRSFFHRRRFCNQACITSASVTSCWSPLNMASTMDAQLALAQRIFAVTLKPELAGSPSLPPEAPLVHLQGLAQVCGAVG